MADAATSLDGESPQKRGTSRRGRRPLRFGVSAAIALSVHVAGLVVILSARAPRELPPAPVISLSLPPPLPVPPPPERKRVRIVHAGGGARSAAPVRAPPAAPPAPAPTPAPPLPVRVVERPEVQPIAAPQVVAPTTAPTLSNPLADVRLDPALGSGAGTGTGDGSGGGVGSGRLPVVTNPTWLTPPTVDAIRRAWPTRATQEKRSGRVLLRCIEEPDGRVRDCRPTLEHPDGYGFGRAAAELSRASLLTPFKLDGRPTRASVTLTFNFHHRDQ